MYSPRIAQDLVPQLYVVARAKKMAMTRLVNEMLRKSLNREAKKLKAEDETFSLNHQPSIEEED